MARIDDYNEARRIAVNHLRKVPEKLIIETSGYHINRDGNIVIPFLDRTYNLNFPGFVFQDADDPEREVPIQEQVLILHYIESLKQLGPAGRWIAYREIPGAKFYFDAFVKRAINPLKKVFGNSPDMFIEAAKRAGCTVIDEGDAACQINIFPRVPLRCILWVADEEFDAEANILFDETAGEFLSPEDAAWTAGMLVYKMAALARR